MPSLNENADVSASKIIAVLEAEIVDISQKQAECTDRVKKLMREEDTARGIVHAQEIYALQQKKLCLEVEVRFRRNKINRLRNDGQ